MTPQDNSIEHPMKGLTRSWLMKISDALEIKQSQFGRFADECDRFYNADNHDFMWESDYAKGNGGFLDKDSPMVMPKFRMTVNRPFEVVALYGPALYHQNPNIQVTPRTFPEVPPDVLGVDMQDPQAQLFYDQIMQQEGLELSTRKSHGSIASHYLNWLQQETDKKTHSRTMIQEAIIKGMSLMTTEIHSPRGSRIRYPRSRHKSVDDLVVDPDAEYWEDIQWVALKYTHPVNLVEREYGLKPGSLKGHLQSKESQAMTYGSRSSGSAQKSNTVPESGKSYDLITYWKIWSKNGFGDRLKSSSKQPIKSHLNFDWLGDTTFIVVADNVPYPLNMPSWSLVEGQERIFERAQWPTPFWTDGGWPFSRLHFYSQSRSVWPVSMIKTVIGEIRFINWAMSFLADRVAQSSQTFVARAKDVATEMADQISSGMAPFTVMDISNLTNRPIKDVVQFMQAPEVGKDIWTIVMEVKSQVDDALGTNELLYGRTSAQLRSAQEAEIKDQNTNIRPDDMASRVEDCASETAMKEWEAAVWHLDRKDFERPIGRIAAKIVEEQILTKPFDEIVGDFSYRVEAGSARKPNKQQRIRTIQEWGQSALPVMQSYAEQGVVGPWNAYMEDSAKALDIDASRYLLPEPEPDGEPDPEQVKAEMEIKLKELDFELKQAELGMKQAEHEQEMQFDREKHEQEMKFAKEKFAADVKSIKAKAAAKPTPSSAS